MDIDYEKIVTDINNLKLEDSIRKQIMRIIENSETYISKLEWQLCPKCNGQGTVSKPAHVQGDQNEWTTTSLTNVCNVCIGKGIIKNG